jgi:hypothetical protein
MNSKEVKLNLSNSDFISKISSAINYLNIFKIANDENPIVNTDDYNQAVLILNSFIYLARENFDEGSMAEIELTQWLQENSQRVNDYMNNNPGQNGTEVFS